MIVISSAFQCYKALFDSVKINYHFHDFRTELDISVWQPKIVLLSTSVDDLYSLPHLAKEKSFVRILMLTQKTTIRLGDSIDYVVTVGDCSLGQENELNLPNLQGANMFKLKNLLVEFLKTHTLLPNSIYVIGASYRPGVVSFVTHLEHEHYIGKAADKFDLFVVTYAGNKYLVMGIPFKDQELCIKEAERHGLRLVSGKPLSNYAEGQLVHFPLQYSEDSIFTLESISKIPQDPKLLEQALKDELRAVKEYLDDKNESAV